MCYNASVDEQQIKNLIDYWLRSSDENLKTAETLFPAGRNTHCLFFCHLAIENMLKALVVKTTNTHVPYTHDLVSLAQLTGISFSNEQLEDLKEINTFNIKARYDDYRFEFYKKATKDYTEDYFIKTRELYLWLKRQLKN